MGVKLLSYCHIILYTRVGLLVYAAIIHQMHEFSTHPRTTVPVRMHSTPSTSTVLTNRMRYTRSTTLSYDYME